MSNIRFRQLRSLTGLILVIAALLLMQITLVAQTDQGRITGTVRDQAGAVIPGATVVVKNERTGDERTTTSNAEGYYQVTALKPSFYTVKVTAPGFAAYEVKSANVLVGQTLTANIAMQLSSVSAEISVSAGDLTTIDKSSAAIGVNVSEREVAKLPLNGRQISQLYLLSPGAVNFGAGTFDDIRFNGRGYEENAIRYDGVEASGIVSTNPGDFNGEITGVFRLQASLENVQEFRVESNNYPAEFGTGTGGQISIVTKSGGNAFNGSLFEYFRNDKLDARNFFDGNTPSILRLNQFGGSIGGPIIKDKFFFFAGVEILKQRTTSPFIETTPSAAVRALPDCPPGPLKAQASPTCMSSAIRPLLKAFPVGQLPSANPLFDVVNVQEPGSIDEYAGNIRFDYALSDKYKLYTRYNRDQGYGLVTQNSTGSFFTETAVPQNLVVGLNQSLSPTLINETKVGLNAPKTRIFATPPQVPGLDLTGTTISLSGTVTLAGSAGLGGAAGIASPTGQLRASSALNGRGYPYTNYSLSFIDNLTWIHGNHNAKFGVEIRPLQMKTEYLGGATYTFSNIQNFLADLPTQVAFNGDTSSLSPFTGKKGFNIFRQTFYIGYAQDEWKIRPNFTVTYGMRYEYYSPLRDTNNKNLWFDLPTATLIPNFAGDVTQMSTKNFGPRLAFTWAPKRFADKTVIRVGGGYFYAPGQGESETNTFINDKISRTISSGPLLTYPVSSQSVFSNYNINDPNLQFQPRVYAPGYKIPERVAQYSLSVEQQLPAKTVLTVGYVGSLGRQLFLRGITNLITGVSMNPTTGVGAVVRQFGSVVVSPGVVTNRYAEMDVKTSGGNDHYHSLQVQLNKRFSGGLILGSQYLWSHSIGDTNGSKDARTAANNYDFRADYGDNTSDVRQSFNVSMLYELPFGTGKKYGSSAGSILNGFLGDWQIANIVNARTGLPVEVLITRPDIVYRNNVTGAITAGPVVTNGVVMTTPIINVPGGGSSRNTRRPDLVPGVDPYLHGPNKTLWINPAAFAIPQPGTFGNLARNALRGPGISQWDLTLAKRFPINEKYNVQFRAEIYNVLNHAVFQVPAGGTPRLADATGILQPGQPYTTSAAGGNFGALTSTVSNQVGAGTNRQIQFSLRFNFGYFSTEGPKAP